MTEPLFIPTDVSRIQRLDEVEGLTLKLTWLEPQSAPSPDGPQAQRQVVLQYILSLRCSSSLFCFAESYFSNSHLPPSPLLTPDSALLGPDHLRSTQRAAHVVLLFVCVCTVDPHVIGQNHWERNRVTGHGLLITSSMVVWFYYGYAIFKQGSKKWVSS